MLDIEDDDLDLQHLPPLTPTPRSLVTSQPGALRSPRVHSQNYISHEMNAEPRRTLKQVSRGHRGWTSGLCSACRTDRRLCCYTCLCAPMVTWSIAERLGESSACMVAWLPGMLSSLRTKIRTIGGIQGSVLSDCCLSTCCPCCVICQLNQEVDQMIVQPETYVKPYK